MRLTYANKKYTPLLIVLLPLLCSILLFSTQANAVELNVPVDFGTIQEAINNASSGDTIFVDSGVYAENINFNGKSIVLQSINGPYETIIKPIGGTVVEIGPGGEIEGFTISDGIASFGSGIAVNGSGTRIKGNIFENNGGYETIWGNSSSPIIEQNIFRNNSCDNQHLSGVVVFVNSSSPRIENNVFTDNPCRAINFTLPTGNHPITINNTIVGNRVGIHVDGRVDTSQQIYRNNLIFDNEIGLEVVFGTGYPTWEHNLVYGNITNYDSIADQTGIAGNISSDPLFVDYDNGDYHLFANSPAVDMGTNNTAPNKDFEGEIRPFDGDGDNIATVDIGAYEYISAPSSVEIIFPEDGQEYSVCSYYSPPTFEWDAYETFSKIQLQYSSYSDFSSLNLKFEVNTLEKQLSFSSKSWEKVLKLANANGGLIFWRIAGIRTDKTITYSGINSIILSDSTPVDNILFEPTGLSTISILSWNNNCNSRFTVWFGADSDFLTNGSKKVGIKIKLTNPIGNEGLLLYPLNSKQWSKITKLFNNQAASTVYWSIDSRDVLKRNSQTNTFSFILTP